MRNLSNRAKVIIITLCVVAFAFCMAIGGYFIAREKHLNELQKEALGELEDNRGEYAEQTIVLRNTSFGEANALAKKYDATLRITSDGKFATLKLPAGVTIEDIYAERANRGDLPKLSADYYTRTSELEVPDDEMPEHLPTVPSYIPSDADFTLQSYINYLHLGETWSLTQGDGITVAVIDTGIDTDHPEFKGKISEYSYNATTDKILKDTVSDGDDEYDWSLIEDTQGHGTAVAGTIAAAWDENGIAGIAPNVTLLIIKAECSENGVFVSTSDLVFGLYYAVERDADIVNMSFGISGSNPFESATQLAVDSDVICVAAAGNDSTAALTYPAADENVIGVGALAENSWELADYSNYGENVDMVAPGTVYTTKANGGYGTMEGTSFASPITAGVLALYLSQHRFQMFNEVKEVLFASCYDLGGLGKDFTYGYGALDVNALVVEEKGKVTFDMLTDELDNIEKVFVRNHTLQSLPEPERNYAVFDGWYYDIHCTEELNWYEDAFSQDLTLYANWVNEDDGVPYTYVHMDDGIEIQSYTGKRRYITIPDEIEGTPVVSIGDFAFANETRLRLVNLPESLKHIGQGAFQNCNNLLEIAIPDNVTDIGSSAFQNNIRLASVYFSGKSKLVSIGNEAFANCSSLVRFSVPKTTVSLDGSAFIGATSMRAFSVEQGNTAFTAKDGVLFTRSMNTLVLYPAGLTAETYAIPDSVRELGAYSFAFAKISDIQLKGITGIGSNAFKSSRLEQVTIPDSVISMGMGAFSNCVYLCKVNLGKGLDTVPAFAFEYCALLESIRIPQEVTIIDNSSFASSGISTIEFEQKSNLVIIGSKAFAQTPLTSIHLPASLMMIGDNAFAGDVLLSEVTFDGSDLQTIGEAAFLDAKNLQMISLPENLRSLGTHAFMNSGLQTVKLPASLTELGMGVFAECHGLSDINVAQGNPNFISKDGVVYDHTMSEIVIYPAGSPRTHYAIEKSVKKIGPAAFYGAWNLQSVSLPQELVTVGEYGFYGCMGITSYTLPQTLESIEEYAFSQNTSLSMIEIPDSVTQIARFAFAEDYVLQTITFGEESKLPRIGYATFAHTGLTSFRVPKNVSTIGQEAFAGNKNLTSLTFAKDSRLDIIPAYFLKGSEQIRSIAFEKGSALTSIAAHGFEGLRYLYSIDFGDAKLTNIDNFAFRYDASLSSITIPESVTNIGRYAFYGCNALTKLEIPEFIEHIGTYAFYGAENLDVYFEAETLPLYLQENWDEGIRGYYVGVNEVTTDGLWRYAILKDNTVSVIEYLGTDTTIDLNNFPYGKVSSVGGNAFAYSDVESIILPDTLTSIQAYAFAYSKLKQIAIPASVEFIGNNAFYNTPISSVTFAGESKLKVIEHYAFAHTKNLNSVTIPASVMTMGTGVFSESWIQSVIFPEESALTELPAEAFYSTKLVTVNLPDSIVYIGDNAFRNTETLQKVTFGKGEDLEIRSNAFYNTGLTALTIPANVEYIGEYAFVGLQNLEKFVVDGENPYYSTDDRGVLYNKDMSKLIAVPAGMGGTYTVPATVETIGFGAFENSSLTAIDFSNVTNLLTFGYRAFYNMQNLKEFTVPASVVSIDYYAFAMCSALERVNFAEGNRLAGIYEGAFYGCTSLKDIELPDSIVEISDYAFYGCSSLAKIPISETSKLKGIYEYAFAYTGITELILPESISEIGAYAFRGTKLTTVTIPDKNKLQLIIGIGVFADCDDLTEITLPFLGASFDDDKITWLGYIFGAGSGEANEIYTPSSLNMVTITEGITKIGCYAFYKLTNLQNINIPHSVTMVGNMSFCDCPAEYELTNEISAFYQVGLVEDYMNGQYNYFGKGISGSLKLAEGVIGIHDLFSDCNQLKSIELPKSLKVIDNNAFRGCSNLTRVIFAEGSSLTSICSSAFDQCINLTNIEILASVTSIGDYAFSNCISLTDVIFREGSQIETIGLGAFGGCISLTSIELPKSLKVIDNNAFRGCSGLTSIKIPNGVTDIGYNAFEGCSNLTRVEIPASVTNMAGDPFIHCPLLSDFIIDENNSSYVNIDGIIYDFNKENIIFVLETITDVTIPASVTSISTYFGGLRSLRSITFEAGSMLQTIEDAAFFLCENLESLSFEKNSNLINISPNAFYGCNNLANVSFGDNSKIKNIGRNVFDFCSNLRNITFGAHSSLISIDEAAFRACTSLANITIPASVTNIGRYAFSSCRNLVTVVFEDDSQLTTIDAEAFFDCGSLTSIEVPSKVTTIGEGAFQYCDSLYRVVNHSKLSFSLGKEDNGSIAYYAKILLDNEGTHYVDGITGIEYIDSIDEFRFMRENGEIKLIAYLGVRDTVLLPENFNGEPYALYQLRGIKTAIIPDAFSIINDYAFAGSEVTNVLFTEKSQLNCIGKCAFQGCYNLISIDIPANVTSIGDSAFYNCSSLINIEFPISLTNIGNNAFYGCSALADITIPMGVTNIGTAAFAYCDVTNIEIPYGITSIEAYTFYRCSKLINITIPDGVTNIGEWAFFGCISLINIRIPASMTTIGKGAFSNSSIVEFNINEENHSFTNIDGVIYDYNKTEILFALDTITNITIPASVTHIASSSFENCQSLESINFEAESQLVSIDDSAFSGCIGLTSIKIPSKVTDIGILAFSSCSGLKSVEFADGCHLERIDYCAFGGCSNLLRLELPEGLTSIENSTFSGCSNLTEIKIPASCENIGMEAFSGCPITNFCIDEKSMYFVNIGGIVYDYDKTHIVYVSNMVSDVEIPATVTDVASAFSKNESIKHITFEPQSQLASVNDDAFYGCSNLVSIVIPMGATSIGSSAFLGCSSLKSIEIPESVMNIGNRAFDNCSSLTSVTFGDGSDLISIGAGAFFHCGNLTTIRIPSGVTNIEAQTFWGCNNLTCIEIPESVTSIGEYAFSECISLTNIDIPASVTNIGRAAFSGCCSLKSIEIPAGVTSIDAFAFNQCNNLVSVVIPARVTKIRTSAFRECHDLVNITFDENSQLVSIEEEAFYCCYGLTSITIPAEVASISKGAFYLCGIYQVTNYSKLQIKLGDDGYGEVAKSAKLLIDKQGKHYMDENSGFELIDTNDKFRFVKENDAYKLIAYVGSDEKVTLPKDFNGTLYSIYKLIGVKNVIVPNTITKIDDYAFCNDHSDSELMSVIFEDESQLESIGEYAFYGCKRLKEIKIPSSVMEIGSCAFKNCFSMTRINIPSSVTKLNDSIFFACSNLMNVVFEGHSQLESICNWAFRNCYALKSIEIPAGVTSIESAFDDCGLTDIKLLDGMTRIVEHAFEGCSSLTHIEIPESVTVISWGAFSGCTSLTTIDLPSGLTTIGGGAFDNTGILENQEYWHDGMLYLGKYLIKVDKNATSITVRPDTAAISSDAFEGCYKLKRLTAGSNLTNVLSSLSNLETLIMNESPNDYWWYASILTLKNIVLRSGIGNPSFFSRTTDVTIYVEAEKNSVMWDHDYPNWSNGNKVYYGGEWISAEFYGLDGELIDCSYYTTSQVIRQPNVPPVLTDDSVSQFVGWDLDNDGEADFVPATSITNIVAHAVLVKSERLYHVNFADENGHVYESRELRFNEPISQPATPEKQGYTFIEWDGYTSDMVATKDITFYAVWSHNGEHEYQCTHHEATCTEWGYDEYTCSVCGESYSEICGEEEPTGHSFDGWAETQAASCESAGSHYRICKNCEEREEEEIAPTGHSFTREVTHEATCEKEGEVTFSCENCDLVITEPLSKIAHHYEKKYVSKTFLQWLIDFLLDAFFGYDNGQPFYYQCTECGQIQTRAEADRASVMAQGAHIHTLGDWEQELAPTCSEYGVLGVRCTVCKELVAAKPIEMIAHQYDGQYKIDQAPTCTEEGKQSHHCIWCDKSDEQYVTIAATGHNYGEPKWTWDGYNTATATFTCTKCDEDADGHIKVVAANVVKGSRVNATCVNKGSQEYIATVEVEFGDMTYTTTTFEVVPATGHNMQEHQQIPATCTQAGTKHYWHCQICNEDFGDVAGNMLLDELEIPATGHNFDGGHIQAMDPTCTENGNYEYYYCATCEKYFKDGQGNTEYEDHEWVRAATGHHYNDDWEQTKAPTYTEQGAEERSCTVCGEKETRDVPAIGLTQKFKDEVLEIEKATTSEQKFNAIKRAAETWNGLSETERAEVQEAYAVLKTAMANYNTAAEKVNEKFNSAFKTAISIMSSALIAVSSLAAVWYVGRKFY